MLSTTWRDSPPRAEPASRPRMPNILAFDGVYGGGRGRITGVGLLGMGRVWRGPQRSEDHQPSLLLLQADRPGRDRAPEEAREQGARADRGGEDAGSAGRRHLHRADHRRQGRALLPSRVHEKLRALCDKLQVPIFADEVLTGGGRTGKFFAYQHYVGFEPDFVTFGKGLQVAGVAQVNRKGVYWYAPHASTTVGHYSEPLLKGAQVLDRIREGKLMENATKVGARIVKNLQKHDKVKPGDTPDTPSTVTEGPSRGIGMLIYTRHSIKDTLVRDGAHHALSLAQRRRGRPHLLRPDDQHAVADRGEAPAASAARARIS